MDKNGCFELVREAKSIAILLEGDLQMNKYDESIIDGIRVIKRLLNQALKHKEQIKVEELYCIENLHN